jgi:hypothetical protein
LAVTNEVPRVLTVDRSELGRSDDPALPFGALDPVADRTLELALRKWVRQQSGLELGYVEQLYTFGDRDRDDRRRSDLGDRVPGAERAGVAAGATPRILSIAYLALVLESEVAEQTRAEWSDCYRFLPWEDRRQGQSQRFAALLTGLSHWAESDRALRSARRERIEIAFGLGPGGWDAVRVLERYELLYEAGLVGDGRRGLGVPDGPSAEAWPSQAMAVDHRRILATALSRLRGKLEYRPLVFELMADEFTLLQLQRAVEALSGVRLHKQNFRRLVERGGLVEGTGRRDTNTGGRPAELFRFRREVMRERAAPGVGLPARRSSATG